MPTEATLKAMAILRDPGQFHWTAVPLLAFVIYVYATELERGNLSGVFAGLAYWLADWLWEILNALVLHFTGQSALWVVSGGTSYLILVGLSLEITAMFAIAGIVFTKLLPKSRTLRILGIPNRWFFISANAVLCAGVECLLVQTPHFHWGFPWWNFPLVVLIGYVPFDWICFRVFDSPRKSQVRIVGSLLALDAALLAVFGPFLHWI